MAARSLPAKFAKALATLNLASVVRGTRFGPQGFTRSLSHSWNAIRPLELRDVYEIPVEPVDVCLGGREVNIILGVKGYADGMLPTHELLALLTLLVRENPAAVVEIGTFMGRTTLAIARNLPEAIVHTVDLPLDFSPASDAVVALAKDDFHLISRRQPGQAFHGRTEAERICQHFVDTACWDFAPAEGATAFFIDGSHTYEYCRNDSEKCYDLCGGKGLFIWHDCNNDHPGVARCLMEWRELGRDVRRIEGTSLAFWKRS